ncbi:MAG TPA: hypothetical protein VIX19_06625 [Terriglobales bacterium]
MPLIPPKPTPPRKQTIALRLEVSTLEALKRYAAFLGTRDLSHVVTGSLEKVFHADKEYKTWLKSHPDSVTETRAGWNPGSNHHPAGSALPGASSPLAAGAMQAPEA